MRLLKLIVYAFIIYFIIRFIQMYKFYKAKAEQNEKIDELKRQQQAPGQNSDVVDADFKKID